LSAAIAVQTLRDSDYDEWGKLVATSPDGSIYATAAYLDTLCLAAGGRFRILAVRRGDQIVGKAVGLYGFVLGLPFSVG
jgi:hypothetical protein